jgi:hypothetical protein
MTRIQNQIRVIRVYPWLKPSRATHRAVVTRLAAGLDTALLLVLEEVDKL